MKKLNVNHMVVSGISIFTIDMTYVFQFHDNLPVKIHNLMNF